MLTAAVGPLSPRTVIRCLSGTCSKLTQESLGCSGLWPWSLWSTWPIRLARHVARVDNWSDTSASAAYYCHKHKTSVAEPYDLQSHAVYWIRPTKVFALRKKPFSVSCSTTPESKQTPTTPFQKEEGVCKKREGFQQTCVRHAFCIWAVTFQTSKQVDQVQKSFWCFGECTALRCKSKISDPRPSRLCMLLLLLDRMHHLPFRWITIKRRKVNRAINHRSRISNPN